MAIAAADLLDPDEPLAALQVARSAPSDASCRIAAEQAAMLIDQAWVNLPPGPHGDGHPIAMLRRLGAGLQDEANSPGDKGEFYRDLLAIFAALGDRHMDCYLPDPFGRLVAFLPFLAQAYHDGDAMRLAVVGSAVEGLCRGDTLVSWNGLAMDEMLRRHAALQLGANVSARRARAVQTLTFRPLAWLPPPDGEVVVEVLGRDGGARSARCAWRLAERHELLRRFGGWLGVGGAAGPAREGISARLVKHGSRTFGYIRIASFQARPERLVPAFCDMLGEMPPAGLVIDLRGCEHGIISSAEQLLQLVSPVTVEPEPFHFRVTELIRHIVRSRPALARWRTGLETAAERGERYSDGHPLTDSATANTLGRRYRGPVAVLVDGLTYSSGEMFVAGVQDHDIGTVIGTAPSTGGGGASPWWQSTIHELSGAAALAPAPGAPTFRVAVRRSCRVGRNAGALIEGVGITPDVHHAATFRDLLADSADLIDKACIELAHR